MSTLANIRSKVRLLAKVPSTVNWPNATIDNYINLFYQNDLPQEVQLFELRKNVEFSTTPNLGVYSTTSGAFIKNLKDFKDYSISVRNPIYISGRRVYLTQSQTEFYNMYDKEKERVTLASGDGVTTNYNFTLSSGILRESVMIGSVNAAGAAITLIDEPNTDAYGRYAKTGVLKDQNDVAAGTIDYVTGAVVIAFNDTPAAGEDITYELNTFVSGFPDTVLFFNDQFVMRPIPDKVYEVVIEIDTMPEALVNDTDTPVIKQWWQAIAYGAAVKILQDNTDLEGIQLIYPEYERQLSLVTTRTAKIRSKEVPFTGYNQKNVNTFFNRW